MKIGILQCDDVRDTLLAEHGNYPEMFIHLFERITQDWQFKVYDVRHFQYPEKLNECDGYITTGSRYSVNDEQEWINQLAAFILQLNKASIKLVGICFGHQLMAKALGGKVEKSVKGWGVGVSFNQIDRQQPWMQPFQSGIDLIVSHQDQVTNTPLNTDVLASSAFCPNYMLQYSNHLISIQGHPEFSVSYSKALMAIRYDVIPANRQREALVSLKADIDARLMMQWMVNFFRI